MNGLREWLSDPGASATLAIAVVAGLWALAQLRPVTRERRRETHQAMTSHYGELRDARAAVVPEFPPLLATGSTAVRDACETELYGLGPEDPRRNHLDQIVEWLRASERYDLSYTSAADVLGSEAKFRSLLWSVETIKAWRDPLFCNAEVDYPIELLEAAEKLAHDLNAFLFHYETGGYPARQTLGLLHRSLAVASKAVEPVVWERSLQARWGRRALRIGIAAQHFNDVTEQHCTSDLTWDTATGVHVIHPRLKELVAGAATLVVDSPARPVLFSNLRLWCRTKYWWMIGAISPTPNLWYLSYGGLRLRRHRRSENQLAGLLNVAVTRVAVDQRRRSTDFSWDMDSLRAEQRKVVEDRRRQQGRLSWLWAPRA